jgi:hypothetical protein
MRATVGEKANEALRGMEGGARLLPTHRNVTCRLSVLSPNLLARLERWAQVGEAGESGDGVLWRAGRKHRC